MKYEQLKVAVGSGYGYHSATNFLKRLAQSDQDSYIVKQKKDYILMSDGTEYEVVNLINSEAKRGIRFHQLILEGYCFDKVYFDIYKEVQKFQDYSLCSSCVPDKIQYGSEI